MQADRKWLRGSGSQELIGFARELGSDIPVHLPQANTEQLRGPVACPVLCQPGRQGERERLWRPGRRRDEVQAAFNPSRGGVRTSKSDR